MSDDGFYGLGPRGPGLELGILRMEGEYVARWVHERPQGLSGVSLLSSTRAATKGVKSNIERKGVGATFIIRFRV